MSKELEDILRKVDFITAALLLSGQITIGGVFIQPESAFALSLTGPITGGTRIESKGKRPIVDATIDVVDILTSLALLTDKINVIGTYITFGKFTIVVGGPLFGGEKRKPSERETERIINDFIEFT